MSEVSVWASMQPTKPINMAASNPNVGPDAKAPVEAPKRLADVAEKNARPVVPGGAADRSEGVDKQKLPQHIAELYEGRFNNSSRDRMATAAQPTPGVQSAVVAKMFDMQSHSADLGQERVVEAKSANMVMASGLAEAVFDGANSKMAQDREMFKAITKDRTQIRLADNPVAKRDDGDTKIAKDRAEIAAQRKEAQATSMVLTAEAGGTGDKFNPTLDLTY